MAVSNSLTLAYDAIGDDFPLVLIHGFPLSRRIWDGVLAAMPRDVRAIAVDLPGFGRSPGPAAATLEAIADSLLRFADALGLDRFAVAGLSMGGYLALALAERDPSRLSGLCLVDSKSQADNEDAKANRDRMIDVARQKGSAAIAELMMPKMLASPRIWSRGPEYQTLQAIMQSCPPETIAASLAAMRDRPDRTEVLAGLRVPVLGICGEHDPLTPPSVMGEVIAAASDGRLEVVSGAGHMAPLEAPDVVAGHLAAFARRCG